MKDLIARLKKKGHSSESLEQVLTQHFSGFPLELVLNQHKNESTTPNKRRYSPTMKEFALTYFYSPKSYQYVRSLFHLPHPSRIKQWLSSVNCEPGFLEEIFQFLKDEVLRKTCIRHCSLIFDSTAIRKQIAWSTALGKYTGYVDCGGIADDEPECLATEALVFQIVSLTGHFKCPVAYFLINKVKSQVQHQLINVCLSKLHEIGITIHSVTCDGTSANFQTLTLLGCHFGNTNGFKTFPHPVTKHDVFVILDACHMLKLARNTLGEKGVITSPLGPVKWDYIMKLNVLQDQEDLKLANKLSGAHVRYHNKKMNVKLTAQTLSSGVADAMDYLRKSSNVDFVGCEATVHFIRMIDRIFDMLNSRSPYGSGYKEPLKLVNSSYWKDIFEETIVYLKSLIIDGRSILLHPRKTFAVGFIISINSIKSLADALLLNSENPFRYLLTYKFSQDHIELLFSCIRARNGSNNNPSADQFKWALRKLLFRNSATVPAGANCIEITNVQNSVFDFRSCKRSLSDAHENESDSTDNFLLNCVEAVGRTTLSEISVNILYYIGGYIVRKIIKKLTCKECIQMLYQIRNSQDHNYINKLNYATFTQCTTRGGLIFPSCAVFNIIEYTEKIFKYILNNSKKMSQMRLCELITHAVISNFSEPTNYEKLQRMGFIHYADIEIGQEDLHSTQLIRSVSSKYNTLRLHAHAKSFTIKLHSNSSTIRQKLNKVILFSNV